jgi:hypothetical protein
MRLSREEYEATITQLATRVEVAGLKMSVDELRTKIEEINKRNREDGDMFSGMLLKHDEYIKQLKKIIKRNKLLQSSEKRV